MEKTLTEMLNEQQAKAEQGPWVPACGGTEEPFLTRTGHRLLYCWQQTTGRHAYLDCGSDLILTEEETQAILSK